MRRKPELYHRFKYFNGAPDKGMLIIPCELIDRNGDNLKKVVLQLAEIWKLPEDFKSWINESNLFLNTLVDRTVPGYPSDSIDEVTKQLGYEDALIVVGEMFHLWIIEGPQRLSSELPFHKAGLNVKWVNDMTPYRTRKVRILNGGHTSSVPAAFLYGLDTVEEMVKHKIFGKYVHEIIYDEIIPSLGFDQEELGAFADAVMERFENPLIKHHLISILLNCSSKYKVRVLPSLLEYRERMGALPDKLCFSMAALISLYRNGRIENEVMKSSRNKGEFSFSDALQAVRFFIELWHEYDRAQISLKDMVVRVLANKMLWELDLNDIVGLGDKVAGYLETIEREGMESAIKKLVGLG
jgi:tagaturonate reductase